MLPPALGSSSSAMEVGPAWSWSGQAIAPCLAAGVDYLGEHVPLPPTHIACAPAPFRCCLHPWPPHISPVFFLPPMSPLTPYPHRLTWKKLWELLSPTLSGCHMHVVPPDSSPQPQAAPCGWNSVSLQGESNCFPGFSPLRGNCVLSCFSVANGKPESLLITWPVAFCGLKNCKRYINISMNLLPVSCVPVALPNE